MKNVLILLTIVSRFCLAQNSYPNMGTAILNSGGDQAVILKDGRNGTNWNYLEWQFNDGSRDWVLGRGNGTGYFTLWRNGANIVLTVDNNGRMGVGTENPNAPLHVKASGQGSHLAIETNSNGEGDLQWFQGGTASSNQRAALQVSPTTGDFEGWTFDNTVWKRWLFVNRTNNNVGIGTSSPDQKLTVKGTIHAEEVKVDLNVPAPDYVFEKDYHLPTLEQIKSYIDQNKHLPEVPSAKEMEANGVNLGEMNMILLKKVEELTLLLIEQNSRNDQQQRQIDDQQKTIQRLLLKEK